MGDQYLKGTEHIRVDWQMVKEYPLSKELLAMSRVFTHTGTRQQTITAKGAPEAIFDLCHLTEDVKATHARAVEELAASGLRVLGVAKAVIG